jgi:hypothetical protein
MAIEEPAIERRCVQVIESFLQPSVFDQRDDVCSPELTMTSDGRSFPIVGLNRFGLAH